MIGNVLFCLSIDEEIVLIVISVAHLEISERNIADGYIKEVIRHREFFISLIKHICRLI